MQGSMYKEIKAFYNKIKSDGMYWSEYIQYKKYLRNKIDDKADDLLSLNRSLWVQDRITKQQYQTMQLKIENSRAYYKRLVSYC